MRPGHDQSRNGREPEASSLSRATSLPAGTLGRTVGAASALALVVMTAYELLKGVIHPDVTVWESHIYTIGLVTVVTVIATYAAFRRYERMLLELTGYRNRLEELVGERTAELASTNIQLRREIEERRVVNERIEKLVRLKAQLLPKAPLDEKLKLITDAMVDIFGADFARVWVMRHGDLCERNCAHAGITEGPNVCLDRSRCLHLLASSGRYTHIDGAHGRAPLGAYMIGCIAAGLESKAVTNDVTSDPRVSDREWARTLGLVSFAGYKLAPPGGEPIGVLALFSKQEITPDVDAMLEDLASATSQVVLAGAAEDTVRESEEKYRRLVEDVSDWVWQTDPNRIFTYASPRVRDILGYEPEEVVGHSPYDFMLPEVAERVRSALSPSVESRKPMPPTSMPLLRKDGRTVVVQISGTPVFDDQGVFLGHRGVARDITEQTKAEETVRQSEAKYRGLVENVNDWVWESDLSPVFTYTSPRVRDILGYEPEEVVGRSPYDLMPPREAELVRASLQPIVERWEPIPTVNLRLLRKDGRTAVLQISGAPIFDDQGVCHGHRGVARDITEQVRAKEEVERLSRQNELILDAAGEGIVGLDTQGNMTFVNPSAARMLGYSIEELIGRHSHSTWHHTKPDGTPYPEEECYVHAALRDGVSCHVDNEVFWRNDGTSFLADYVSTPILEQGSVVGAVAVFTDITERKRSEEALRENEERYRNLVETTETGYLIVDGQGRVVDANAEYVRLTGRQSLEEIRGRTVLEWTAEYDLERNAEEVKKCAETGVVRNLVIDYVSPDGAVIPIEINGTVIETREGPRILTLCRDITERRLAEEERRALEIQMEAAKRVFYRETILSVTDGKLTICDQSDVEPYIASAELSIDVCNASQVSLARRRVERLCQEKGLTAGCIELFVIAAGEAITNAIKHGAHGQVYAGQKGGTVWVAISDSGPGIESLILPRAVLRRGYSTKPSLGLGYTVMLQVADSILLKTDRDGTTVVLAKHLGGPALEVTLDQLPDTWDSIPA